MNDIQTADTTAAFIARWELSGGKELANYQSFLIELCSLLGVAPLSEWSENFNSRKNVPRNYYTLKSIAEMEAYLAKTCEGEAIAYALTGFSGAARYAPSVRYQRVMAYVSRDVESIAKILSLKEVASGANVALFTPYDEGVLYGARQIDGICIASPVQVYLDLLGVKGRGEEAAKTILDEVIRRSW